MVDPCEKLNEVIMLCEKGVLPPQSGEWASSAIATAEGILTTIEEMISNEVNAPTQRQGQALQNIYDAACRWLN